MDANPNPRRESRSVMPSWLPRLNKLIINPVQGLWAPYLPPFAVIVHRGRRSGTLYRTPVLAFRTGTTLAIALPYGPRTDWVRNLTGAGHGEAIRLGRRHALTNIRITDLPRTSRKRPHRVKILLAELG